MNELILHKKITLYRGLKASDFVHRGEVVEDEFRKGWLQLLEYRASGDLSYPEELNDVVIAMSKLQPFTRQYFTDRKELAESYAKEQDGILVSIEVTIQDILDHFIIEFQNYSKRKDQFDVVYIVRGSDLFDKKDEWRLEVQSFG